MLQTSLAAYHSKINDGTLKTDRYKVFAAYEIARFGTRDEISVRFKIKDSIVWRRQSELLSEKKLRRSIYTKAGLSGKQQHIMCLPNITDEEIYNSLTNAEKLHNDIKLLANKMKV